MGLSSLHVCMESSADHWLQGTIHEESGMDSSSPSGGGDMLTCSRTMIERRLRPPHDQALKCPRCDSTHTKFCYYNNYSLSQPRYFCKTCRRYWTKGGTLRNIPVGGGCRKNKKVSAKKSNNDHQLATNNNNQNQTQLQPSYHHPKDLQLSFPDVQFSHLSNWTNAGSAALGNPINNFMENKYNSMLEINNPRPIDFMESKLEGIIGSSSSRNNNFDFFGNSTDMSMAVGMVGGGDIVNGQNGLSQNFHGLCNSPAFGHGGMSYDGGNNNNGAYNLMDSCQRLMLPYDQANHEDIHNAAASIDVKPNPKLLSLEWQDQQGCSDHAGKESSFGYLNGPGSWTGMMNGYGSSTTNPLV